MVSLGDKAPDFETKDESKDTFRLSDYRGKACLGILSQR